MTGYLWECERCKGLGFFYLIHKTDIKKEMRFSIGQITILENCMAKKWDCPECAGRGYWGP